MEWYSGILLEVYKRYLNPGTGKPLVYISPRPVYNIKWITLGANKRNPWNEQMDKLIQRAIDFGLPDQWRLRTLRQIKEHFLAGGGTSVEITDNSGAKSITATNMTGALLSFTIGLMICLFIALVERQAHKRKAKQKIIHASRLNTRHKLLFVKDGKKMEK